MPNSPSEDALTADGASDGAGLELSTENTETVTNSRLASLQVIFLSTFSKLAVHPLSSSVVSKK